MHWKLIGLIACALVVPASALTDASKTELKKLVEAMRAEAAGTQEGGENQKYVESYIVQIERQANSGNALQLEQSLIQYAGYFKSNEVSAGLASLRARLEEDRRKAELEDEEELEALFVKAEETVKKAKDPSELDEIIAQLGKVGRNENRNYNRSGGMSENMQRLVAIIEPTRTFLEKWQDYLSGIKANDLRMARQALAELKQSGRDPGLLPRSQVLAKLQELSGTRDEGVKLVMEIKNLEDISEKLGQLQKMNSLQDGSGGNVYDLITPLSAIEKNFREYSAGMPIAVETDYNNYNQLPQGVVSKLSLIHI